MLGNFNSVVPIILAAFLLWLIGLTVVFYRLLMHYKRIGGKVSQGDLVKLVNKLIDLEEKNTKQSNVLIKEIERIDSRLRKPLQKYVVKQYNPFAEIGGQHSFSVCMLDEDDNGFVLTNLHTRDRTRVYVKPVAAGVTKLELSKEEEKALKEAKNKKL